MRISLDILPPDEFYSLSEDEKLYRIRLIRINRLISNLPKPGKKAATQKKRFDALVPVVNYITESLPESDWGKYDEILMEYETLKCEFSTD